uniref:F-box domain-containing protein n=1 Tax=Steinernema glaseri TaxID=37863 RepID=A0A1I7YV45_9BILA
MDSVPPIFVESVCLLLDRQSLEDICKVACLWGEVSSATIRKIHFLRVFVEEEEGKLYAAALPCWNYDTEEAAHLESVNLKFITNFIIKPNIVSDQVSSSWKEITLNDLQRLVRLITPTTERRHPLRYDNASCNGLQLYKHTWITEKLISLQLPFDSVNLWIDGEELKAAVEEFFENAGPLYNVTIRYTPSALKQSTVDTLIDKFVPADDGHFQLDITTLLTRKQLERLVLKCEMSDKRVMMYVWLEGATSSTNVTDFFEFDKYYSKKGVEDGKLIARREGAKLELRVFHLSSFGGEFMWRWDVSRTESFS